MPEGLDLVFAQELAVDQHRPAVGAGAVLSSIPGQRMAQGLRLARSPGSSGCSLTAYGQFREFETLPDR